MPELYEDHRRCPSCDYWADKKEWSVLSVDSASGSSYLICRRYDFEEKNHQHVGSVDLLACPRCRTMVWER